MQSGLVDVKPVNHPHHSPGRGRARVPDRQRSQPVDEDPDRFRLRRRRAGAERPPLGSDGPGRCARLSSPDPARSPKRTVTADATGNAFASRASPRPESTTIPSAAAHRREERHVILRSDRSGFSHIRSGERSGEADCHRFRLDRGSGVVRRCGLPAVLRHPEQPDHAMDARRRRLRLPRAVELRERTHPGSGRPSRLVRARRAARDPDRARRLDHRHRRALPGQTDSTHRTTWW